MLAAKLSSPTNKIPTDVNDARYYQEWAWKLLPELRTHLQSADRLHEAFLLLEVEVTYQPDPKVKAEIIKDFLATLQSAKKQPVWWLSGKARLLLALALHSLDDKEEAGWELERAEGLFCYGLGDSSNKTLLLQVTITRLKLLDSNEKEGSLAGWRSVALCANAAQDFYTESIALQAAVDIATELYTHFRQSCNREILDSLLIQSEQLFERLGDLMSILLGRITVDYEALKRGEDGAVLIWHNIFEKKHPNNQLWELQNIAKKNICRIYYETNDYQRQFKALADLQLMVKQQKTFWERFNDSHYQVSEFSEPPVEDSFYSHDDEQSEDEKHWATEWLEYVHVRHEQLPLFESYAIHVGSKTISRDTAIWTTLLRWIRKDFVSGKNIQNSVFSVLGVNQDLISAHEIKIALRCLDSYELANALLGNPKDPVSIDQWSTKFEGLSSWLLFTKKHEESKRHILFSQIQRERYRLLTSPDKIEAALVEFTRLEQMMTKLSPEAQRHNMAALPFDRNAAAYAKMYKCDRISENLLQPGKTEFEEILVMFTKSLKEVQSLGLRKQEATTHMSIAELYRKPILARLSTDFEVCFDHLRSAEKLYLEARDSLKNFRGWEAVQRVVLSSESFMANDLFPIAISTLLMMENPDEQGHELWTWIEKAKAQGLARLMKSDLSCNLLRSIKDDQSNADIPSFNGAGDGTTWSALQQLEDLSTISGEKPVFINWYSHSTSLYFNGQIIIAIFRPGQRIKAVLLPIQEREVNRLAKTMFSSDEKQLDREESMNEMQRLASLVEPLQAFTRPGETLVFLPSGLMHRIPLHALKLDGKVLISRNPIVYSTNTTLLLNAFQTRTHHEELIENGTRNWRASVFGDPNLDAGKSAIVSVAKSFGVLPNSTADTFRSTAFTTAISNTSMFHYHGHAEFQYHEPLEHMLKFADKNVPMRDVFELGPQPPTSFHATLLGCGSGMCRISNSNEVFGLVPAFQYAGAASTVSTLWSIDDADAALFSKAFYSCFSTRGSSGYVNLAKAMQTATLAVMKEKPTLYHWAPFVLAGWWMYKPGHGPCSLNESNPNL